MDSKKRSVRFLVLFGMMALLIFSMSQNQNVTNTDIFNDTGNGDDVILNERPLSSEYVERTVTANLSEGIEISDAPGDKDNLNPIVITDSKNNVHFLWNQKVGISTIIFYRVFYYANQSYSPIVQASNIAAPGEDYHFQMDAKIDSNDRIRAVWKVSTGNPQVGYLEIVNFQPRGHNRFVNSYCNPAIGIESPQKFLILYFDGYNGLRGYYNNGSFQVINVTRKSYTARALALTTDSKGTYHGLFIDNGNSLYYIRNKTVLNNGLAENGWDMQNLTLTYARNNLIANPQILYHPTTEKLYVAWEYNIAYGENRIYMIGKDLNAASFVGGQVYQSTENELNPVLAIDSTNKVLLSASFGVQENKQGGQRVYLDIVQNASQLVTFTTSNSTKGFIGVDLKNNVHMLYHSTTAALELPLYKVYDRQGPELNITSPINGSALTGDISLNVLVAPDTYNVTYWYYEDPTDSGIPPANEDDWQLITSIVNSSNRDYSYSWSMDRDFKSILIKVLAVDVRGLDEMIIRRSISVDIYKPQQVEFVSLTDSLGRDVIPQNFGIGNITVSFTVYDNCSGIDRVELRNGATLLATNRSWDGSNQLTWVTTNFPDGNYSGLFLRAYDRSGWSNDSEILSTYVLIDNTKPQLVDIDSIRYTERTGTFIVRVQASADTDNITMYVRNETLALTPCVIAPDVQTGVMSKTGGNIWELNWRTVRWTGTWEPLDGNYTLVFVAADHFNNTGGLTIDLYIDNTVPFIELTSHEYMEIVGFDFVMEWDIAADTKQVGIYLSKEGNLFSIQNDTGWVPDYEAEIDPVNSTHARVNFRVDAFPFKDDVSEISYFRVVINCTDRVGLNNASVHLLKLYNSRPDKVRIKQLKPTNNEQGLKDVELTIAPGGGHKLSHYLIYRTNFDIAVDELNKLTVKELLDIMGRFVGDEYCIGRVEYDDSFAQTGFIFVDANVTIGNYYYTVLLFNDYDNPGLLSSEGMSFTVPLETPERDINWDNFRAMPFVLLGIVGLLGLFAYFSVKATKSVRTSKEIKKTYKEVFSEDAEYDSYKALSGLSSLGKDETISDAEFLSMTVEVKEEALDTGVVKMKTCEHCGWVLSKDATKCPRCQKPVF